MKKKRRTHSPEFKARVAMEALKGIKPVHQIASENEPGSDDQASEEAVGVKIVAASYCAVRSGFGNDR